MKKILFIKAEGESAGGGGVERQIMRIARELANRVELSPILVTNKTSSALAQSFEKMGFMTFEVQMNWLGIRRSVRSLCHIISSQNVVAIQSHLFFDSLLARFVRKHMHNIYHIFRAETYIEGLPIARWKKKLCYMLEMISSKYVDMYVVNGRYLRRELIDQAMIKSEKIVVLYNGTDQLGLPDSVCDDTHSSVPSRVVMVANLLPGKGHDTLIKGLALLKKDGLRVRVRLVGGVRRFGDVSKKQALICSLKKQARRLGVLDWLDFYGYTKDVYSAIKQYPIVVLPSDSEGIPNCILEGMSLRKIVIASQVGGVPEIIQNGSNGLLHGPANPEAFASCLSKVLSSPAKQWDGMRLAAYETWQARFSVETMMKGLIDVYGALGIPSGIYPSSIIQDTCGN